MNHPDLYLSGAVRRWHTHPIMSRFGQTNAEHQWGALMLLLILHPNPDRALMLAVATHDVGERKVGDVPWDAKQDDPGLAARFHRRAAGQGSHSTEGLRPMIYDLYRSGFVQRYAQNPEIAWTGQTLGHHQWGVTVLLMRLFPERATLRLVWEALHHDTGEMGACDASYPAKQRHPAMAQAIAIAEANERADLGVPALALTDEETAMLKFCDHLESYLFASVRAPWVLGQGDWKKLRFWLEGESFRLNVAAELRALLEEAGE